MSTYIAVDFGGGSGRVMAGLEQGGKIDIEEIYRFPNRHVRIGRHLYWDFPMLFDEMLHGLKLAAARFSDIVSIGIDSWGVDYGLIDTSGNLLENPRCYRDEANVPMPAKVFGESQLERHYAEAGIQILPINTLYQLMVRKEENSPILPNADRLLFMSDLFIYYLTGIALTDYCIATTSELIDARSRQWNYTLIDSLGLPRHIFGDIIMPGTERGTLLPHISEATGLPPTVRVISVGSHDTACAVHAVPFRHGEESDSAFLSSGTWSLLGILSDEPILTEQARRAGFSNEGAVGGKIKLLQNITGLWLLQNLIKEWAHRGLDVDYAHLMDEASKSGYEGIVDVDDPVFVTPGGMERKIRAYLSGSGYASPAGKGDMVRCVLRSLAERYRKGVEQLNVLRGKPIKNLHIIGGGCKNTLLNRYTEEATGVRVIAGPDEATALGNIRQQYEADKLRQERSKQSQG